MKPIFIFLILLLSGMKLAVLDNNKDESIKRGEEIYIYNCQKCHMNNGEGGENLYPPLAGSDYLFNNINQSIKIIMMGSDKDIVVNGKTHDMEMEANYLSDQEIADVMNYILNSWGNAYEGIITEENVAALR